MTGLEPFLIGAAATTATATTAATVATAGMFGVGGAFSIGTALGTVFQIGGALASFAGQQQQTSASAAQFQYPAAVARHNPIL